MAAIRMIVIRRTVLVQAHGLPLNITVAETPMTHLFVILVAMILRPVRRNTVTTLLATKTICSNILHPSKGAIPLMTTLRRQQAQVRHLVTETLVQIRLHRVGLDRLPPRFSQATLRASPNLACQQVTCKGVTLVCPLAALHPSDIRRTEMIHRHALAVETVATILVGMTARDVHVSNKVLLAMTTMTVRPHHPVEGRKGEVTIRPCHHQQGDMEEEAEANSIMMIHHRRHHLIMEETAVATTVVGVTRAGGNLDRNRRDLLATNLYRHRQRRVYMAGNMLTTALGADQYFSSPDRAKDLRLTTLMVNEVMYTGQSFMTKDP